MGWNPRQFGELLGIIMAIWLVLMILIVCSLLIFRAVL